MSHFNLSGIVLILVVIIAVGCSATQEIQHPLWDRTVTLPSGEVVLDMDGEWDHKGEGYGVFSWLKGIPDTLTVKQDGNMFVAIKQVGSKWVPAGADTIKGELDKNGFKAVYAYIGATAMDGTFVWEECLWVISERGNKVDLDCGDRIKRSLTRK